MGNNIQPSISVVIPNYEGQEILERNLQKQFEAISQYRGESEIILVDDGSKDSSVEWVEAHFKEIQVLRLSTNQGFGAACNAGAIQAKHEILFFINNDMEVLKETFEESVGLFKDKELFGVRLGLMMEVHKANPIDLSQFYLGLTLRRGFFELPMLKRESRGTCEIPSLSGGASAVNRKLFLELEGFDPLFLPAYWEDVDLSLRAWQRGWKILFEPKAICFHEGSQTTKKVFTPLELKTMSEQHRYYLVWKQGAGLFFWLRHVSGVLCRLVVACFTGQGYRFKAFFKALEGLPVVLKERKKMQAKQNILFFTYWEAETKKYPAFFENKQN